MSDFGTSAKVHRTNGDLISPSDEVLIKQIAVDLIDELEERWDNDFLPLTAFDLRYGHCINHSRLVGVYVTFTEYYLGDLDDSDGLVSDALIERDRPYAKQFGEGLQQKLGPEFKVEVYCGGW